MGRILRKSEEIAEATARAKAPQVEYISENAVGTVLMKLGNFPKILAGMDRTRGVVATQLHVEGVANMTAPTVYFAICSRVTASCQMT